MRGTSAAQRSPLAPLMRIQFAFVPMRELRIALAEARHRVLSHRGVWEAALPEADRLAADRHGAPVRNQQWIVAQGQLSQHDLLPGPRDDGKPKHLLRNRIHKDRLA